MDERAMHILLLEEEKAYAEVIRRAFESHARPCVLRRTRSVREAREALEQSRPDVIVTEWMLRDGKGIGLLSLESVRSYVPVIVMDAFANAEFAVEAMRAGAADFVDKSPEVLQSMPEIAERAIGEWRLLRNLRESYGDLAYTERGLCSILQTIPDIVYRLDHKGRILFINNAIARYGYRPDALVGRDILDLVHEEDREAARFRLKERRTGERSTRHFEVRLMTPDRSSVPLEVRAEPIEFDPVLLVDAEGLYGTDQSRARNFQGTQGVARDITDRKQSEKFAAWLLEMALELGAATDLREAAAIVVRTAREMPGVDAGGLYRLDGEEAELICQSGFSSSCPDPAGLLRADSPARQAILAGRALYDFREEAADSNTGSPSGGAFHNLAVIPLLADGRVCGALCAASDASDGLPRHIRSILETLAKRVGSILERVRAEQTRERLEAAVEKSEEALAITDPTGTILYANSAFEVLCGGSARASEGTSIFDVQAGVGDPAVWQDVREALDCGRLWRGNIAVTGQDGRARRAETVISPLLDAEGALGHFVFVQRDATRNDEIETQRLQSQKMEALGALAGGVAHDFNNILAAILGFAELGMCEAEEGSASRDCFREVLRAGERATNLVQQILTFSRGAAHRHTAICLRTVVGEALDLLRTSIPATIEIKTDIASECAAVLADPTRVHQVLMNLCTNAYHAMSDTGGELRVALREVDVSAQRAAASIDLTPGRFVCLSVSDTGHGMDEATKNRIFEPYFTTKKAKNGTGLGLATVHGIVKHHGGAILVDSKPGRGTRFDVYFPISPEAASNKGNQDAAAPTGRLADDTDRPVHGLQRKGERGGRESYRHQQIRHETA